MRIITITFCLLTCSAYSIQKAISKDHSSPTQRDLNFVETTQTPETTNIRNDYLGFDPVNDVASPQSALEPAATKTKRCSRHHEILVGRAQPEDLVTLSLSRRDLGLERRKQQKCTMCRKIRQCKDPKNCSGCDVLCGTLTDEVDPNSHSSASIESNDIIGDSQQNIPIIASRFSETPETHQDRYFSLGAINPGASMNLVTRMVNGKKDSFDKLVVLGKLQGLDGAPDFEGPILLDTAKVINDNGHPNPDIYKLSQSNAIQIETELEKAIKEAFEDQRNKLKVKTLTPDQVNKAVNDVLREFATRGIMKQRVGEAEPETQTRCSSDESVDLFDAPPENSARQNIFKPQTPKEVGYEMPKQNRIKNPPVIQDNLNFVGNQLDEMVDDNEEARPSRLDVSKPKMFVKDPNAENEVEHTSDLLSDSLEVAKAPIVETRAQPDSDNQVKSKLRHPYDLSEESESSSSESRSEEDYVGKAAPIDQAAKESLKNDIIDLVEESLKMQPEENTAQQNTLGEQRESDGQSGKKPEAPREDLEQDIKKLVDESLNVANINALMNLEDRLLQQASAVGDKIVQKENPKIASKMAEDILSENIGQGINSEDVETPTDENNDLNQGPADINTLPEDINVAEASPDIDTRNDFSSLDKSFHKFGAIVPASTNTNSDGTKKVFFVGKDINLPLRMFKDKNGILQLTVDMDKLCNCKSVNCTRKHMDSQELDVLSKNSSPVIVSLPNEDTIEDTATILPELKVRMQRDINKLLKIEGGKRTGISKRSPKLIQHQSNELNKIESNDIEQGKYEELSQIEREYKFDQIEENLEKLEQLSDYVMMYNKDNQSLLNKGTVAFLRNTESTKNSERVVNLASNLLAWMKHLADKGPE